jgi:RluA family pseudouridine synthase
MSEAVVEKFIEDFRSGKAVIHEDDDLIVLSKPCGIPSIPERKPTGNDLASILSRERGKRVYVVHRLDKDVSGVIVFAKNAEAHRLLNRLFESRHVEKTYVALVHGVVKEKENCIRAPLRRFGSGRVGVDHVRGKESITNFKVVKRFNDYSLLFVFPKTGRNHQIRVHLYHIGHPVVGDPIYGASEIRQKTAILSLSYYEKGTNLRLMLHALSLRIPLPTGEAFFKAFLSDDFRCILKRIKS